MLKQTYVMQRAYFVEHDRFFIPPDGTAASAANPMASQALYVEIIGTGRYTCTIEDDKGGFIARAVASDLDQDPVVDEWTIDNMGATCGSVGRCTELRMSHSAIRLSPCTSNRRSISDQRIKLPRQAYAGLQLA